jgi:hypothetical protein
MDPNETSTFREKVQGWTCNHFAIHAANGQIVWLLRELAARIVELGNVKVLDVVVIHERDDETDGLTGKVYFYFPGSDEDVSA